MNKNSIDLLIDFIEVCAQSVCHCSVEVYSRHRTDCMHDLVREVADNLIKSLRSDETII